MWNKGATPWVGTIPEPEAVLNLSAAQVALHLSFGVGTALWVGSPCLVCGSECHRDELSVGVGMGQGETLSPVSCTQGDGH